MIPPQAMYLFWSNSPIAERIQNLELMALVLLFIVIGLTASLVFVILTYYKTARQHMEAAKISTNAKTSAKDLISYYFRGKDEERERISRDLHDGVCSSLLGARYLLEPYKENNEDIAKVSAWLQNIHRDLRHLSHELAPPELLQTKLEDALQTLMTRLCTKARKEFAFDKVIEYDTTRLSLQIQQNLYRVMQELIGNIIKYSDATQVEMRVISTKNDLELSLEDNSSNYKANEGNGIGLENIKLRLKSIDAHLELCQNNEGVIYFIKYIKKTTPES